MSRQQPNPNEFTREVADELWLRNMLPNGALDAVRLVEDVKETLRMQQRTFYSAERQYLQPWSADTAPRHRGGDVDSFSAYDQAGYNRFAPPGAGDAPSRPWLATNREIGHNFLPRRPGAGYLNAHFEIQAEPQSPRYAPEYLSRKRHRGSAPQFPPLHPNIPTTRSPAPPPSDILESNEHNTEPAPLAKVPSHTARPRLTVRQMRRLKSKEVKARMAAYEEAHHQRKISPLNAPTLREIAPRREGRDLWGENYSLTQECLRLKAEQEKYSNYLTCARCYSNRFPCDHNYPCLKCQSEGVACQLVACEYETRDECRTEHCIGLHPDQVDSIKSQEGWGDGPIMYVDAATGQMNIYPRKGTM